MQRVTYAQFPMVTANKQWPTVRPFVRSSELYDHEYIVIIRHMLSHSTKVPAFFFCGEINRKSVWDCIFKGIWNQSDFFFFTLPDTKIITIVKFLLNSRCDWQDKNYEKLPNVLYTTNDIILTNCTILVVFRYSRYELKIRYLFPDNYYLSIEPSSLINVHCVFTHISKIDKGLKLITKFICSRFIAPLEANSK